MTVGAQKSRPKQLVGPYFETLAANIPVALRVNVVVFIFHAITVIL